MTVKYLEICFLREGPLAENFVFPSAKENMQRPPSTCVVNIPIPETVWNQRRLSVEHKSDVLSCL